MASAAARCFTPKFNATFADQAAGGPGINIITNGNRGDAFFRLSEAELHHGFHESDCS